jgi:hypothetical protein
MQVLTLLIIDNAVHPIIVVQYWPMIHPVIQTHDPLIGAEKNDNESHSMQLILVDNVESTIMHPITVVQPKLTYLPREHWLQFVEDEQ